MTERYLRLIEMRLATLRLLAKDLEACRAAHVALNLEAINEHTRRQERFCSEIRTIDAQLRELPGERGAAGEDGASSVGRQARAADPAYARQRQALTEGLKVVQADLKNICRVHSGLLRRSRRSVGVLLNCLAHYSGKYPVPATMGRARSLGQ